MSKSGFDIRFIFKNLSNNKLYFIGLICVIFNINATKDPPLDPLPGPEYMLCFLKIFIKLSVIKK